MWNLQKATTCKKSTALDVEPVYTFRGHTGPVLCLEVSSAGDYCFSGGLDGTVRCWNIPPPSIDPYDTYDASVMYCVLEERIIYTRLVAYLFYASLILTTFSPGCAEFNIIMLILLNQK